MMRRITRAAAFQTEDRTMTNILEDEDIFSTDADMTEVVEQNSPFLTHLETIYETSPAILFDLALANQRGRDALEQNFYLIAETIASAHGLDPDIWIFDSVTVTDNNPNCPEHLREEEVFSITVFDTRDDDKLVFNIPRSVLDGGDKTLIPYCDAIRKAREE